MFILYKRSILIGCALVLSLTNVDGQVQCRGGADCITLQSCRGLYDQLKQGSTPQLTQLLRSLHCGFDERSQPMICCPPEFTRGLNQPKAFDAMSLLPTTKVCGIQNNDRITGGGYTDLDEHPWMALLKYNKSVGTGFYCGGVLISSRYVLTAAHCVGSDLPPGWKLYQVRLGEWDIGSSVDCIGDYDCAPLPLDIPVEEIIQHELYSTEDVNQLNDIALLRLSREVTSFNDFVKPICLPLTNELKRSTFIENTMEVAGWGKTENNFVKPICLPLTNELKRSTFIENTMEVAGWGKTENTSESEVKLKALVPVVPIDQCANVFQRVNRAVRDTQICAGGVGGRDSCRGDSGGPLMGHAMQGNNWIAVGVVSYYGPSPCGTEGWPGVYTRVGAYVDWILSKMRP